MRQLSRPIAIFLCLALYLSKSYAADRYWVHPTIYKNHFSTVAELADWQLIEDDGTGGFAASGSGTGLLSMDDAGAGSHLAVRGQVSKLHLSYEGNSLRRAA